MSNRSLKDLFHRVRKILPEEQDLLIFPPNMPIKNAIDEMLSRNFSQVPVLQGNEVLGIFSFRSISEGMLKLPQKEMKNIRDLHVEEFLESFTFAHITDEITSLIDDLDLKDAVFIGSEVDLQGVITTIDVLRYFYNVASPFVILGEIELAIRALIHSSVDEKRLIECIDKSLSRKYEGKKLPLVLEELTFWDYVNILNCKETWDNFRFAFGNNKNIVHTRIKNIPDLRNILFHFKRDITIQEYNNIKDTRDWLLKRIKKVDASRGGNNDI